MIVITLKTFKLSALAYQKYTYIVSEVLRLSIHWVYYHQKPCSVGGYTQNIFVQNVSYF